MMDHGLALVLLAALLIFAAAPLAYAWAQLLPEERLPFEIDPKESKIETGAAGSTDRKRDPLVIFLLIVITISYILKFPGIPLAAGLHWMERAVPENYFGSILIGAHWFFLVTPGLAAVYAAVRRNPFRISLILGGILVLSLWLANPYLRVAIQK